MSRLADVAALFLRAAVADSSLTDFFTGILMILSVILLLRYKINSTWRIAAGALAGYLSSFVH